MARFTPVSCAAFAVPARLDVDQRLVSNITYLRSSEP